MAKNISLGLKHFHLFIDLVDFHLVYDLASILFVFQTHHSAMMLHLFK